MTNTQLGAESHLKVGQAIIFYPDAHRHDGPRHEAIVRGWQKGAYVLLEITPVPMRGILFRENAECSLRFLHNGVACSMESTIIDWQVSRKKPTFAVSWPRTLRTAAVRRNERVELDIPCTLYLSDKQISGTLQDLSIGGCGIASPHPANAGDTIVLSTTLPDGVYLDRAPVTVRNVRETRDGAYYLGCMLQDTDPITRANIEFYVTTTLLRARGSGDSDPVILFLDPELSADDPLPTALRNEKFEVYIRSNLIDGISFARLRLPAALLVHHDWKTATAIDFARVFNTSPTLQKVPLIVYNAPDDTHAPLTDAGAEHCYTTLPGATAITQLIHNAPSPPAPETPAP